MNRVIVNIVIIILISIGIEGFAQQNNKHERILIIVNVGASMNEEWGLGINKYDLAKQLVTGLVDSMWQIDKDVEFGLRAFGHLYRKEQNNCSDSRREVNFTKDNYGQISLRMEDLKPKGTASVSNALKQALQEDITETIQYRYTVVLLTDNNTQCDEAICKMTEILHRATQRVYVLQLSNYIKQEYNCIGKTLMVSNRKEIEEAQNMILEPYRKLYTPDHKIIKETTTHTTEPKVQRVDIVRPIIKKDSMPVIKQEQPIKQLQPSGIRPIISSSPSKIKVAEAVLPENAYQYGYIKLINATGVYSVSLYLKKGSEYSFYMKLESEQLDNKRVRIREGKYKIEFSNSFREFTILPNMITEVDLK